MPRPDKALARVDPGDGPSRSKDAAMQIQSLLQAGDAEAAATLARRNIEPAGHNPRLAQMCFLAFSRAKDRASAESLAEDLVRRPALSPEVAAAVAFDLVRRGRPRDALDVVQQGLALRAEAPARLRLAAAQALLDSGAEPEAALAHLDAVKAGAERDLPFLRLHGELLLVAGRNEEAASVLERAVALAPKGANVLRLYARALKQGRRHEEASEATLRAMELDPTLQAKRLATSYLLSAGRADEARAVYDGLVGERRSRLAPSFAAEVAALDGRLDSAAISKARFDWGWQVTTRALGRSPSEDRADWERRGRWGHLFDLAIIDWLECRPDRAGEVAELFDDLSGPRATIEETMALGRGALLASAHIGPLFSGPLSLPMMEIPHRWVASTPAISAPAHADTLLSTSTLTETQVARQVIVSVQSGLAVVLACDGAMSPNSPRVEWEGRFVTYSSFAAALSFRLNVPSLFATPYWTGRKLTLSVRRLPDPIPGEALAAFAQRWQDKYFAEIVAQFLRGPENMRFRGGIWRGL